MPHADVSDVVRTIRESDKPKAARLAVEFLILTAARSGEVREARWSEIDLEARTWTIPADRMKAGQAHRVPLSDQALAVLRQIGKPATGFIFANRGKVLADSTLLRMVKPATIHGFRSSFRDWVSERTTFPREIAEAALAHTIRNKVEAAYARSDLLERRRPMMQEWADYATPA